MGTEGQTQNGSAAMEIAHLGSQDLNCNPTVDLVDFMVVVPGLQHPSIWISSRKLLLRRRLIENWRSFLVALNSSYVVLLHEK